MPVYESTCIETTCPLYHQKVEWYAHRADMPDPPCESCKGETKRCVSGFAVCWTKPLHEYSDPQKEGFGKLQKRGGHWVARKRSRGAEETGVPVHEFIQTKQQQREYCKSEGLVDPSDLPNTEMRVAKDGKSIASNAGEPGTWT